MDRDLVYRIERPDGTFRGSGSTGKGKGHELHKLFRSGADVIRHLKLASSTRSLFPVERLVLAEARDDVVVEYELREVRRIPTEDFLKEREK